MTTNTAKTDGKPTPKPKARAGTKPEPKAESKPGAKPAAKDDLKSLPLQEVEERLGYSPDGLSAAEAKNRLTQYGPNEMGAAPLE